MITKEKFERFVRVQVGGRYNMYTESMSAGQAACLNHEDYYEILDSYSDLMQKYPDVRPRVEKEELEKILRK